MTAVFDAFPARARARSSRGTAARPGVPVPPPAVPPGRAVPSFPPIRVGCGGRHRLRQALRRGPGPLTAGLLATAAALAAGPPPGAAPPSGVPRCASSADGGGAHGAPGMSSGPGALGTPRMSGRPGAFGGPGHGSTGTHGGAAAR
ncbi:hypothetical protein [Peterkaempfera griseoplana]|uniref:hypothetical protein n=1 Tax=Peterkaempfera griseoplana TaxID=66896 RepID=UPI000AC136CE|nr:hypothetical protein [Peterkaempfera griseoplana]